MDKHSEKVNKQLENKKKNQTELKNTIAKMKNTLEGIDSRLDDKEEWLSKLEDRVVVIIQAKHRKEERIFKNEDNLGGLWDNIKYTNICIIGVPKGEEREKEAENLFEEIIAENFPNLGKETDI